MLKIVQITDPVCTWCYGNEPQTRAIAFLYDAQCKYLMGGLVEDIRNFYDAHNAIGGTDIAATNAAIIAHWREASARHKMPVTSGAFCLLSEQYPSTWPQNIAYKAAQIACCCGANLIWITVGQAGSCILGPFGAEQISMVIEIVSGIR